MAPHVAHHRMVVVPAHMLVVLLRGVQAQVGDGDPRHEEVGLTRSLVQAVAANGHEVGEWRARQIAVERSAHSRDVASRRR